MSESAVPVGPAGPQTGPYPQEWEASVVLRDGSATHIRPIRPSDADALQRFHLGQSEHSTYLRFFAPVARLSQRDLHRFTLMDHVDREALIAVRSIGHGPEPRQEIIGVARYERVGDTDADVAFNIADAEQGKGLGSVLLEHLAAVARERGVRHFTADVLPHNGRMLAVFDDAGYKITRRIDDGVITVGIDLDPTERSRQVMADRERRAESRSMRAMLHATSLLVVGPPAGSDRFDTALATQALRAAAAHSVGIAIESVGALPDLPHVRGYDGVADVPGPVDLAVVALAPDLARAAVPLLARLGVKGIVLLSGGYAEQGTPGLAAQRALLTDVHTHGMRVVGPASYGVLAGHHDRRIVATLAHDPPPPGNVGLFCQSAPVAVTLLDLAARRGLGISSFISAGNRADVSGSDALQYWHTDSETHVACLSMESSGNPRKFARIVRRHAQTKPVVVLFTGRVDHIVPRGHVGRPTHASRRTWHELLRRSGAIEAQNIHHMIDVTQLLAHQPLPQGRRVGVVASSAALAALIAEECAARDLAISVAAVVPENADDQQVAEALAEVYAPEACDAVVAVDIPTVSRPQLTSRVAAAAARTGRATVSAIHGLHGLTRELTAPGADGVVRTVPAYATPHDAVSALASVSWYAQWRRTDHGSVVRPAGIEQTRARERVTQLLGEYEAGTWLSEADVASLLACYGIAVQPRITVCDAEQAVHAADVLGWPVALASTAPALRHRADLGAVRLDIVDEEELRADVEQMRTTLGELVAEAAGAPLSVQAMVPPGTACVLRTAEDPLFGPVISFGLAGDAADLLGDLSSGIAPLTDVDIAAMVRGVRAAPKLFGYRGAPPADTSAIEGLIARIAMMADDLPELADLELRPVLVAERGATVLAARVRLAPAQRADALRRAID